MLTLAQINAAVPPGVIASGDFHAMAAAVNSNLTTVQSKLVGDGEVSITLGAVAGPVFMYRLKQAASMVLPSNATDAEVAPVAMAQQAVESLSKGAFDVGNANVRAGIDAMVGTLLSIEQATIIKALAEIPYNVTWEQVREVMEAGV